ncbi:hypothetical protein P8S54_05305 [Thiomicrospira sp. R3]|uniref:hypothetical protein n=1 Tax=Thiomicrospira sp. R3 TaxID=3035472 RepID=UPI00259B3FDB|nr:hypothetical protein [Thiomicrospira sp. R3]WFE69720.1 hypothetical protein P8S54_05305 [Thiomicrospira sp. R3]
MKLRSPSGKVITNRFIRSKLQKKQEKLNYSSSFASTLNYYDLVWMGSYLINTKLFLKFVTLKKQTLNASIRHIVRTLKSNQFDEFFAENTRFFVYRETGILLQSSDLKGSWLRKVDFSFIYLKLLFVSNLVVSTENYSIAEWKSDFESFPDHVWHVSTNDSECNFNGGCFSSLLDTVINSCAVIVKGFSSRLQVSHAGNQVLINSFSRIDKQASSRSLNELCVDIKVEQNAMFSSLIVSRQGRQGKIDLARLAMLLKNSPCESQYVMSQGYTQKALREVDLNLGYDQGRLIMMLVYMLSLHNQVKLDNY